MARLPLPDPVQQRPVRLRPVRLRPVRLRPAAAAATTGLGLVLLGVLLVGALHVLAPDVDPVRRTISEYALGELGLLFDAGVVAIALGSAAVLVALTRAGLVRLPSAAAALLGAWTVGLLVVVAFEKTNWSVGPSLGGYIHRYAGLVAFLGLPLAAVLVGRRWRGDPTAARWAATARLLGVAALAWLAPIVVWFALRAVGVRLPVLFGLVERGLALTEVVAVIVLGLWALRTPALPPADPAPIMHR